MKNCSILNNCSILSLANGEKINILNISLPKETILTPRSTNWMNSEPGWYPGQTEDSLDPKSLHVLKLPM